MVPDSLPEKYFITHFRPRFRDTDRVGHVNNAVFATYVEIARVEWWSQIRKKHENNDLLNFILGRLEIDYRAAIQLGDELSIAMWVSRIGNKSWEFSYTIFDENTNRIYAEAKTVQVVYDYKAEKTIELNEVMRNYLKDIFNEE